MALLLFFSTLINAQMQAPQINFENKVHDFGTIEEAEGEVTYVFEFSNIGNKPLILQNVLASCGCTTPKWSKEPILPNGKGSIEVTYNPRNRPGVFRKSITVVTNAEIPKVYLTIQGKVNPREKTIEEMYPFKFSVLSSKKTHLSFFNISNHSKKTSSIMVLNTTEKPIEVKFPNLPAHIEASDVTIPAGKEGQLIFTYNATLKNDWGYVSDNIYCWIDGAKSVTPIKISATIVEDFSKITSKQLANAPVIALSSRKSDFGTVKVGEIVKKTFTIKNSGKSTLKIRAVKSTSDMVTCELDKTELQVGESTIVRVFIDTKNAQGRQYKVVNVISNDPNSSIITHSIGGSIVK